MPPRDRDGVFHRAEQTLRDATITFANGYRLEVPEYEVPELRTIELDELTGMPITSIGAQEANFSMEGTINLDAIQDAIDETMSRQREAELQALRETVEHALYLTNASARAYGTSARAYGTSFIDDLNAVWEKMGDDFELADEEEYVGTDPISFDELMGGCCGDD